MRRNQDVIEPSHESDRQRPDRDRDRGSSEDDDEDEDEDTFVGVAHQRTRLPGREQDEQDEEEDVAEDDIVEILDDADLSKMEGPDA